jgi:hypothetical protein
LVVGSEHFTAAEFLFTARGRVSQNTTPATRARIATAGTVREELHKRELCWFTSHWRSLLIGLLFAVHDTTALEVVRRDFHDNPVPGNDTDEVFRIFPATWAIT